MSQLNRVVNEACANLGSDCSFSSNRQIRGLEHAEIRMQPPQLLAIAGFVRLQKSSGNRRFGLG